MASTYTDIGTELMTTGENAGNWGTKTNTNIKILEEAIRGYVSQSIAGGVQTTALTYSDGSTGDAARNMVIALTGTITGNQTVTVTAKEKMWVIDNQTTGAYTVNIKVSGQTGVTWAATDKGTKILYCNGTDVVDTDIGGVGAYDLNGESLTLDADADTDITADTDDQIDIKVGGTDRLRITTAAISPSSADGMTLGTAALEFSDLFLADSSVIKFGNDQDTTLTHTDGTGLTLNSTNKLMFNDASQFIQGASATVLDIAATDEIELTATLIDVVGALTISGITSFPDGSAGAPSITNTGDVNTGLLFSAADTMSFSAGGTAQFTMADGAIAPVTDNDIDLGTASLEFKNVYVDGTVFADALGFGTVVMTLPTADGDANQILTTDGSGALSFVDNSGGTDWQAVKTGAFTASAGQGVFVNTTSSAFTITLPAGTIGDEVSIIDYAGTADSNNITIAANGSEKIHGSTDDLTVATERAAFTLVFTDSTQGWLLKDK